MSIQNHPNVQAVKLMLDTKDTVFNNLRGEAEKQKKELEMLILNESRKFAERMSDLLDEWVKE